MVDVALGNPLYDRAKGVGASRDSASTPSGSHHRRFSSTEESAQKLSGSCPGPPANRRWHCAATHGQQEHRALSELLAQGFDAYLPLHLDRRGEVDRIIPMFAGYVFVGFDADSEPWGKVQNTRGVWGLLMSAPGRPQPVPVGIVEDLIARTSARRVVDDPGTSRRHAYMALGSRARVTDGPFEGWEGVCTLSGPSRVRLLLSLFSGGAREVEFNAKVVKEV